MMSKVAKLHVNGSEYELPIVEGSEQETAIDISNLRSQSRNYDYV